MTEKNKKSEYNKKFYEKQKLLKEQEKPTEIKIKPEIKNENIDEDMGDVIEIDEEYINNLVNKKVQEQLFFLNKNETKTKKMILKPPKTETSSLTNQVYQSLIIMSIPMIAKFALQAVGNTLLKPSKPVLPAQPNTEMQYGLSMS